MVEGGATPMLSAAELGRAGLRDRRCTPTPRCAAPSARSAPRVRRSCCATGSTSGLLDAMATWEERQEAVGKTRLRRARGDGTRRTPGATCGWPAAPSSCPARARSAPTSSSTTAGSPASSTPAPTRRRPRPSTCSGRHVLPGVVDAARPPRPDITLAAHARGRATRDRGGRGGRRHDARRLPHVARAVRRASSRSPAGGDGGRRADRLRLPLLHQHARAARARCRATSPTSASARSSSS